MPTKTKPTRPKAPAEKARRMRKSALEVSLDALTSQLSELGRRVTVMEERAPIPGPMSGKGDPADMARLEALERRIAELEKRLQARGAV
jgi:uncharacterized protein YceH (UPF0502 family)